MKITLQEVKAAMADPLFRATLPEELTEDILKYEKNPNCSCNIPIYKKLLQKAQQQLVDYYSSEAESEAEEVADIQLLLENNWSVINCHINELENRLKSLAAGRKQLALARFEDQITVIINEIDQS